MAELQPEFVGCFFMAIQGIPNRVTNRGIVGLLP